MKHSFLTLMLLWLSLTVTAQVTSQPAIIEKGYTGPIVLTFDPSQGNGGMVKATECYSHIGLITSASKDIHDWKYIQKGTDTWGTTQEPQWTRSGELWQLTIPNIYTFFSCPETEEITAIVMVFHNGKGNSSLQGKTATGGDILLYLGKENKGSIWDGFTPAAAQQKARPSGIVNGIYYGNDGTSVTLCTYAAGNKTANNNSTVEPAQHVFLLGDMTDWQLNNDYQLYRDGNYFWIHLTGLEKGKEYRFQYVVVRADGAKKQISDLFSEKVIHPDDMYEPRWVHSDLIGYPLSGADDGYVTVIQPGKPAYQWSNATLNFQRPDKNNLVIYETWIYDFTPNHSIPALLERLDYIANLGVNCLELMPVTEFDGNESWGYSPNHYFAVDKTYGSPEDLKQLVDECHKRGIAVVLDMVFNHATGQNPMNKLYPWTSSNESLTDLRFNPWFNVDSRVPHPDNVYQDWNHDFAPAKDMFRRAVAYWLTEYKVDGYRFDLSHGLCGTTYTALANINEYYQVMQTTSPGSYLMLEHWGSNMNSDRPRLVQNGMMCWQNTAEKFQQAAGAWLSGDDLSAANLDNYVSYSNNHDEERPFFKAKQWGEGSLKTSVADRASRVPAVIGLQCMLDGPQLFYHFDELAYDYSKWQRSDEDWGKNPYGMAVKADHIYINGSKKDTAEFKMNPKPRPESRGWFQEGPRMQAYQRLAQAIRLRTRIMPDVFTGKPTASQLYTGAQKRYVQWGNDVYAVANFSATKTLDITLPAGTWYDYYAGGSKAKSTYTLQPNEFRIFTGSSVQPPVIPSAYDYADGIEQVEWLPSSNEGTRKVLIDGQILILREDGSVYTVTGTRLR